MGKGNRNRENRVTENNTAATSEQKLSKLQQVQLEEKKAMTKRIVTIIAVAVIVLAIIASVVAVSINNATKLERTVAGTSEKYEITDAMMAYFLGNQYYNALNDYNSYYSLVMNGFNTGKSLYSQQNFYTSFMSQATNVVKELVALASDAQDHGIKLEQSDYDDIENSMAEQEKQVKAGGFRSLKAYYKNRYAGISLDTVRKCLELQQLASKYYNDVLIDTFAFTDEEIEAHASEERALADRVDYLSYTFPVETVTEDSDVTKPAAEEEAKNKATELAKNTTEEAFRAAIVALERAKLTEEDGEKTDDDLMKSHVTEGYAFTEGTELTDWMFDESRKVGDTFVIENATGNEANKNVTGYTAYYLTKTCYRDETLSRSVRHILLTSSTYGSSDEAKAKAEAVLAEYKAGAMTEEAFGALAKTYTEDSNKSRGGLYEEVTEGQMVTAFNDWLFDEARKPGDVDLVETSYGWHVMYYVGEGRETWKVAVDNDLTAEAYEAYLKEIEAKYPVDFNVDNLWLIDKI